MMIRVYRSLFVMALLVPSAGGFRRPAHGLQPQARISETRRLMGVPWRITAYAPDGVDGSHAVDAAFAEIARLERVLSDYDPESELSRLSARAGEPEPTTVSDDLWQVLVMAEEFRRRTDGAFDVSVGPLTALWRQSRRSGKLPRPDKLAAALAAVGSGSVELLPAHQAVRLPKPGTRLDPGGIGMGFAADRAMDLLATLGISAALIDASGDILVSGPPPGADGWRIAVAPLEPGGASETIVLVRAAVTTSGDAFQAVEIEGERYSHIVDPRTGRGVPGPAAVTVIAQNAATADAVATAASVLGPQEGLALVETVPGAAARFVWRTATDARIRASRRWPEPR